MTPLACNAFVCALAAAAPVVGTPTLAAAAPAGKPALAPLKPAAPVVALEVTVEVPLYNGRAGLLVVTAPADASPIAALVGTFNKKAVVSLPASPDRRRWYVLAPVDIEKRPGLAPLVLVATLEDGTKAPLTKKLPVLAAPYETSKLSVDSKFIHVSKQDRIRAAKENIALDAVLKKVSSERLWRGSFAKPVPGIETSPFGTRRTYNGVTRSRHFGWDLNGATGTPITASARGRVVLSADRFYSGGTVVIDHGQGLFTMYFHMSQRDVKDGDFVEKGQGLGLVGATGRVTGPHLHFTFKLSSMSLDAKYLLALDLSADADDTGPRLAAPSSDAGPVDGGAPPVAPPVAPLGAPSDAGLAVVPTAPGVDAGPARDAGR